MRNSTVDIPASTPMDGHAYVIESRLVGLAAAWLKIPAYPPASLDQVTTDCAWLADNIRLFEYRVTSVREVQA